MKAREVQRELAIFRILAVCFFAFCFLLGKWMNTAVVFAAPRPASLERRTSSGGSIPFYY